MDYRTRLRAVGIVVVRVVIVVRVTWRLLLLLLLLMMVMMMLVQHRRILKIRLTVIRVCRRNLQRQVESR